MQIKVCKRCGVEFSRSKWQQNFERAQYCGIKCALASRRPTTERTKEMFWEKVDKSAGESACWPWTGATTTHGYGNMHMLGRNWGAHKAAYKFANGEIPSGLHVRHTCDNRVCCNPKHLLVGTIQDNMDDKKARGRSPKTMRKFLTAEQVRDIRAARGTLSSGDIAKKYGITQSYAFTIWAGKVWRNV